MDNKQYAQLAHEANLQGKILIIDGDNYWFEDQPETEQQEPTATIPERVAALEEITLAMMLGGPNV